MDTALKIYIAITVSAAILVGWTAYTFVTKFMALEVQAINLIR